MCGIAVVHDRRPTPERVAEGRRLGERMLPALVHRGPDGTGSEQVGSTWLGHTRLAIVDLAGGAQPMTGGLHGGDHRDGWWVVANGEVYNHRRLRERLAGPFRTRSDSEVILHALSELGAEAAHELFGMYAFGLAHPDGRVVLGRDPLGIKPLYWAQVDDRVVAASELAAFAPELRTAVEEFPPGHVWTPHDGLRPLVDLRRDPLGGGAGVGATYGSREQAMAAVREVVVEAVRDRMMSDVPLGVFLSGGLDSSIVAAIMAREAPEGTTVRSFAAGTEGSADLAAARVVAAHLGLEHHERVYTDDEVVDVLPAVVRATESYEPSLIRSAVPNYLLSELAARHVKVVLTGEGADELFAGYHHLRTLDVAGAAPMLSPTGSTALHHLNLQRCRPRDHGPRAGGAGAVPVPSTCSSPGPAHARWSGSCWATTGTSRRRRRRCCAKHSRGGCPSDILWRRKEQFGDGSGTAEVMARQRRVGWSPRTQTGSRIRSAGPATRRAAGRSSAYQRIFAEHLARHPRPSGARPVRAPPEADSGSRLTCGLRGAACRDADVNGRHGDVARSSGEIRPPRQRSPARGTPTAVVSAMVGGRSAGRSLRSSFAHLVRSRSRSPPEEVGHGRSLLT